MSYWFWRLRLAWCRDSTLMVESLWPKEYVISDTYDGTITSVKARSPIRAAAKYLAAKPLHLAHGHRWEWESIVEHPSTEDGEWLAGSMLIGRERFEVDVSQLEEFSVTDRYFVVSAVKLHSDETDRVWLLRDGEQVEGDVIVEILRRGKQINT